MTSIAYCTQTHAVLIASSECELQVLVTILKENCESNSLNLNENKTKVLVFERNEERTECKNSVNDKNRDRRTNE